jgi:hypothetical protein
MSFTDRNEPAEEVLPPDPVIEAYKPGIDETLLLRNLRLTVQERLDQLAELQRFAAELRRAGKPVRALDG